MPTLDLERKDWLYLAVLIAVIVGIGILFYAGSVKAEGNSTGMAETAVGGSLLSGGLVGGLTSFLTNHIQNRKGRSFCSQHGKVTETAGCVQDIKRDIGVIKQDIRTILGALRLTNPQAAKVIDAMARTGDLPGRS